MEAVRRGHLWLRQLDLFIRERMGEPCDVDSLLLIRVTGQDRHISATTTKRGLSLNKETWGFHDEPRHNDAYRESHGSPSRRSLAVPPPKGWPKFSVKNAKRDAINRFRDRLLYEAQVRGESFDLVVR